MKKTLLKVLSVLLALCFALPIFTACYIDDTSNNDYPQTPPTHSCTYTKKITTSKYKYSDATCLKKATYYLSCECGEYGTKTFEYGEVSDHIYIYGKCKWCNKEKPTQSAPSTPSTPTQPEDTSRIVYITPTGKRFHYLKTCAGKNASETTQNKAEKLGLTGCKVCT